MKQKYEARGTKKIPSENKRIKIVMIGGHRPFGGTVASAWSTGWLTTPLPPTPHGDASPITALGSSSF